MARIYVASSWRNKYFPEVVDALRAAGHQVYDFRNPALKTLPRVGDAPARWMINRIVKNEHGKRNEILSELRNAAD